jgi:hypothetical protein
MLDPLATDGVVVLDGGMGTEPEGAARGRITRRGLAWRILSIPISRARSTRTTSGPAWTS